MPGIAVFGSSEPVAGDPLYEQARELGRVLADAGHTVVTGGYGGVMEGASRGAREAGGATLGVCCAIFPDRSHNDWVSTVVETPNLFERTRELIERSQGFVILPGKAGTLAELTQLWALHRAGCLDGRPVVLLGDAWSGLLQELSERRMLDAEQVEITRLASTPGDAVEMLGLT